MKNQKSLDITRLIREASPYRPAGLDTIASHKGHTTLSKAAITRYDRNKALYYRRMLTGKLHELQQQPTTENLARAAQIRRLLTELELAEVMVSQAVGGVDRSSDIHALEKELYGHYSPLLFKAALRKKIELLAATPVPEDMELARVALLDELKMYADSVQVDGEEVPLERPSTRALAVVGEWLHSQFGDVFDEIDAIEGDELTANQLVDVFNFAIETTPDLRDNGWRAKVIERAKPSLSVAVLSQNVLVPSQRRVSKAVAKNLLVYEVFGHALRSGVAESGGDEIGTMGTATYGEFEESFEIALEQCLEGEYDPKRGLDHYISIGLAESIGLAQRKIAQLTISMHQIELARDGLTQEKIVESEQLTERQIRRTFAGMTDVNDGIAHRKDIDYLHGLNGAWRLLNAIVEADQVDEGMRWLLSAKFNPFDAVDRALVNKRVPMPSSIAAVVERADRTGVW